MRLTALICALPALLALSGCGGRDAPPVAQQQVPQQTEPQVKHQTADKAETDDGEPEQTRQQQAAAPAEPQQQAEQQISAAADGQPQQAAFTEALSGRAFEQPIELLAWPGGGLAVAEQRGSISLYRDDGEVRGVLDLSGQTAFSGERGLLSAALDPRGAEHPYIYVWYSPRVGGTSRLSRFPLQDDIADRGAELVILELTQPYPNHNGGAIRFGPDGMLYLGIGDGGAANDPHGHGQNRATLLGAIIRIDVRSASAEFPYQIPADNPFLGVEGVRPEIFAWGLRNPWRMAFDPDTGALWVGDVGQNRVEEVGIVEAGSNQGWNVFEGDECFRSEQACAALTHSPPLAVYGRELGCSVTGGVVYRGSELGWLIGHYLFADYCSGRIWALNPDDAARGAEEIGRIDARIASFGVDHGGEVYLLTFDGPIRRLSAAALAE